MKLKIYFLGAFILLLVAGSWFFRSNEAAEPPKVMQATQPVLPKLEPPKAAMDSSSLVCGNFFKVACENRKVFHDPTGVVDPDIKGEVNALRLYETIMHEHRSWTSERVEDELARTIYTRKRVKQLFETFDWVKEELHKFIERQPQGTFTELEQEKMLSELDRTVLELPPPISVYADELDLLTKNDVYYEQTSTGKKRMRVGGAYLLSAKSWYNRVFTFAHELAHSIDPCEMESSGMHVRAYDRLQTCLLDKKIIHKEEGWVQCGDKDQFSEAFADWVASSITAEAFVRDIDKFHSFQDREYAAINAVKDICDEGNSWVEIDTTLHPSPRARVEGIFSSNQEVRRFLDCHIPRHGSEQCDFGKE